MKLNESSSTIVQECLLWNTIPCCFCIPIDTHHICSNSHIDSYHDLNAPPTQQWQAVTIILFEHKLQVIFSSFCMCLMESYINIDNESVSRNPEILVTRWIQEMCQNSWFVKLCSFWIIIHVYNDPHKTFLKARFVITGGLLCITKSQGFKIICFEQLVLRNVLVALNHIQMDNWQLDPSPNI